MAFISSAPIAVTNARFARSACAIRPVLRSSFAGARPARIAPVTRSASPRMEFEISEGQSYKLNIAVLAIAFAAWIIPSSLPAGIPLTEGTGLTQAFFASMNANLAAFPKGPSPDDPFWTLMFLWHVGLFACLIFGTIGANLKKHYQS